jgi:hypothetical protein
MIYARLKKDLNSLASSISAEITTERIGESGDYDFTCILYHNGRQIGSILDFGASHIEIRGCFDFEETGKIIDDESGLPELEDKAFELSLNDLRQLQIILETWDADELDTNIWKLEEEE